MWLSQPINHDKFSQPVVHMVRILGKLVKLHVPEMHLAWIFCPQTAEFIYDETQPQSLKTIVFVILWGWKGNKHIDFLVTWM